MSHKEPPRKKQKLNEEQAKSCATVSEVLNKFSDRCEEEIPFLGFVKTLKQKDFKFINAPVSGQHIGLASLLRKVLSRKYFFETKKIKTTKVPNNVEKKKKIEKKVLSGLLKNVVISTLVNIE